MNEWTARPIVASRCVLGESPIWDPGAQAFVWVDIRGQAVHRFVPDRGDHEVYRCDLALIPGIVLGASADQYVAATVGGLRSFDFNNGFGAVLAHPLAGIADHRYNEMKRAPDGRIWVGTMQDTGQTPSGQLLRETADGFEVVLDGLHVPNALCWPGGGKQVVFCDSAKEEVGIWHLDGCRLERHRFLLNDPQPPGRPDGIAEDSDGTLWNARFGGGCVIGAAPDGRMVGIVRLPVTQVTSCCFGGVDMHTLFITTSQRMLSPEELQAQPMAGDCFAVRMPVPGKVLM